MNHHCKPTIFHLFISILLLTASVTPARGGRLFTADKLTASSINCIIQDRKGYVWVGTDYGLNRFDGYGFRNYLHKANDTNGIIDNIITTFLVDRKGRLWVGTGRGVMRYDSSTDRFLSFPYPDGRHPRVYALTESHDGDILVGSAGYGLYTIPHGEDAMVHDPAFRNTKHNYFFAHLLEDSRHQLWQSSHLPVFSVYSMNDGRLGRRCDYHSPCGAPVKFIETGHGNLLIVCLSGILRYDARQKTVTEAGYDLGAYRGNITINNAFIDRHGTLLLGTSEYGVLCVPRGTKRVCPFTDVNREKFDLSTAYVKDLYEDKDGNLWAGCYRRGLYLINREEAAFSSFTFASQGFATGTGVTSLAADGQGGTWCTVQNSGVYHFNAQGQIDAHPAAPSGTSIIYRDRDGHYWVGTGTALYSYNPQAGSAQQRASFQSDGVWAILDDAQGHLFFSVYSKGLYCLDKRTGRITIYSMTQRRPDVVLCNDWVRTLCLDHRGRLWIGTSNGVSCLDTRTGRLDAAFKGVLLKNVMVNSIAEDRQGTIVFGTDEGLYRYQPLSSGSRRTAAATTPHAERYPGATLLDGQQVNGLAFDQQGELWVTTTMGLYRRDHRTGAFMAYVRGSGLCTHEYALGAILHNSDDRLVVGHADGITMFYPRAVRQQRLRMGQVYLTGFDIDGQEQDCGQQQFRLSYQQNSFTLQFSLLNYQHTADISYSYSINDGKWIPLPEGVNTIPFTRLAPGTYDLRVRAMANGQYSTGLCHLTIRVSPPWYASWPAILLYIIMCGLLVFFILNTRERRRRTELEDAKMKFLIDATHDIRSPLTLIMAPLKKLRQRLTDPESTAELDIIHKNADRLMLLVNQILDERKIDKGQFHLHPQQTEMGQFLTNLLNLYRYSADDRHITLTLLTSQGAAWDAGRDRVVADIDRVNMDKVVSNLLSNAMKYTQDGGKIDVIAGAKGSQLLLSVRDTGPGFGKEKTNRLFERFYQGERRGSMVEGTGIGLNLCRSIVELHEGKIHARNRRDGQQGAVVEITLPLKSKLTETVMANAVTETTAGSAVTETPMANATTETVKANATKGMTPSSRLRILVVDDDTSIADYIRHELGQWYRIDTAANGREALDRLFADHYDLVISDVKMPVMDGIDLVRHIKGNVNLSDTPVILLSSKAEVEDRMEGLRKGADAYMAKPFDMEELHVVVGNLVGKVRRLKGKYMGAQTQESQLEQITVTGNNNELMQRIMKCVNAHLSDPDFNVERLTEEVGISRSQLHRKMKELTGISTNEFIRNLRMEEASRLLRQGDVNITQVAYAVGFNSQAHFSTVFKKYFGMSPTAFIQQQDKQ